ncbi:Hemerythrin domain-containing protein [Mycena kentingensis (nom. inval.)]|nr:Hemerythrin domain-containing protein [Mycena kentingensis (nom. inval.)]
MPFPFAPIPRAPGSWDDVFEHQAIEMSISHNMFIRGLNALYAQAEGIQEAQVQPFVFFALTMLEMLHHHHTIEEELIFPFYEAKLGAGSMEGNVEQHHAFMAGLTDLEEYLKSVKEGAAAYSGTTLVQKLDSFSDALVEHLHDEIPTLEAEKLRKAFTEQDFTNLNKDLEKRILAEVSLLTTLPLSFVLHEKASAPFFPPLPKPLMWAAKNVLSRWYAASWAFGPCDMDGVIKPGLGNEPLAPVSA